MPEFSVHSQIFTLTEIDHPIRILTRGIIVTPISIIIGLLGLLGIL